MTISQTGTVKWFNAIKGYGFIAPDGGGKDVFAHFRQIQGDATNTTLREAERVEFTVTRGPKGPEAANIRAIACRLELGPRALTLQTVAA